MFINSKQKIWTTLLMLFNKWKGLFTVLPMALWKMTTLFYKMAKPTLRKPGITPLTAGEILDTTTKSYQSNQTCPKMWAPLAPVRLPVCSGTICSSRYRAKLQRLPLCGGYNGVCPQDFDQLFGVSVQPHQSDEKNIAFSATPRKFEFFCMLSLYKISLWAVLSYHLLLIHTFAN